MPQKRQPTLPEAAAPDAGAFVPPTLSVRSLKARHAFYKRIQALEAAAPEPIASETAAPKARPRLRYRSSHVALSESYVSRIRPVEGEVADFYDDRQKKLSLRVTKSGVNSKGKFSWRFTYRRDRRVIVMTLGSWPVWTAAAALTKARRLQLALDEGQDPAAILRPHRAEPVPVAVVPTDTFAQMFQDYERDILDKRSSSYRINTIGRYNKYVLPALGDRPVKEIARRELADLVASIRDTTGYERTANIVATSLGSFFGYLLDRGVVDINPAAKLPKTTEKPRSQVLTVPQLCRVWRAAGVIGYPAGAFVKLLIAVPVRLREGAGLPRHEIDVERWLWSLPASRNKSARPFVLPLPPLAQDILASCPDLGSFYFTSTGKRAITGGFAHIKEKLDREIARQEGGPLPDWQFHDLRRSISTCMAELKVSQHVIDLVLNHGKKKLTATYNQYEYLEEKTEALRLWDSRLSAALAGAQRGNPADPGVRTAAE